MSIIIKKKAKYNKKKIIQRIIALAFIYFLSFFLLYAFFGERNIDTKNTESSTPIVTYANDGEKFLAEGQYPKAVEYFIQALSKNPDDAILLNRLAQSYYKLNQIDKAKFYYYKSIELAPQYSDNYVQVSTIYIDAQDYLTAENIIDLMPLKNKNDFLAKGKILLKLAKFEDSLEEKIIHYSTALNFFKKYDKNLYLSNLPKFINTYFELAQYYIDTNNTNEAVKIYKNITKYQDDCIVNNKLAFAYKDISSDMVLWHIKKAVNLAQTQDEKRMTKKNLIYLRNHFEKKSDTQSSLAIKDFMATLDASKILVDEKYTKLAVTEDKFDYIFEKDEIYPEVTFTVKNQSQEKINYAIAKAEIFATKNPLRILDSIQTTVILRDLPLKPEAQTKPITLRINKNISATKIKNYTVALSISLDGENWLLYRLFTEEE